MFSLPGLSPEHREVLDTGIKIAEIENAITYLRPNKVTGLDGFTSEFLPKI